MGQYEKGLSHSHSPEGSAAEGPQCIFSASMPHLLQARMRFCSLRKQIKLALFLFWFSLFLKESFPHIHVIADAQMRTAWENVIVGRGKKKVGAKVTLSTISLKLRCAVTGGII